MIASDPEETAAIATRLAEHCRAGDVLVLSGELGAGKTTFTQALAKALGITAPVTSPTFVIAREHPGVDGRAGLAHVDAYRLGSALELDDLDIDVVNNVVVVEWGEGLAERLGEDRLLIRIGRGDDPQDETRMITFEPFGTYWTSVVEQFS
jgi:tRNA threonylcarbamoyladenosine biosynthesis protein TsaE